MSEPKPDPRADEADGADKLEVEWRGAKYVLPRSYREWPYLYTYEMERGNPAVAFQHLLGPKQFARFVKSNPTNGDFDAFDVLLGEALGVKQGESDASSS